MKLYSIRHKISGKFYVSHTGSATWNSKGPHFWKTIDGIKRNLMKLGSEKVVKHRKVSRHGHQDYYYPVLVWSNFDAEKLKDIEVIVTNVSVLGEESFDASDFIKESETA